MPAAPLPGQTIVLIALLVLAASAALACYGRWVNRVKVEGGRVRNDWVDSPDLILSLTLGGALLGLAVQAMSHSTHQAAALNADQVIMNMKFTLGLTGGLLVFLLVRKLPLRDIFGLRSGQIGGAIGCGTLMLIVAVPILIVSGLVTLMVLRESAQDQQLVRLFRDVVRQGDTRTISTILLAGIVVAPITEELLFRGYFYPVAKRYFGSVISAIITALVFATLHGNLASLPSLMVLALCFTLAYERTGSLLSSIGMHMLFNASNLFMLYLGTKSLG